MSIRSWGSFATSRSSSLRSADEHGPNRDDCPGGEIGRVVAGERRITIPSRGFAIDENSGATGLNGPLVAGGLLKRSPLWHVGRGVRRGAALDRGRLAFDVDIGTQ